MAMHMQNKKGFTIIELIVAMASGAIIISALLYFFSGSLASYRTQLSHVAVTADARVQMQRIVDTLRNAQDNGEQEWLQEASTNSIIVWTDTNGDAVLEKISYTRNVAGNQLIRTADDVPGELLQNLDPAGQLFAYYDEDGAEIIEAENFTADTIKSIGITLALIPDNPQSSEPQVMSTRVTPRQNLQGDIIQIQGPNEFREVIIEVPAGAPPDPSKNTIAVTVQDPSSGAVLSKKMLSFSELNDGRLSVHENGMYAMLNYKKNTGTGLPQGWYVWIAMNLPIELNLLTVPARYPGSSSDLLSHYSLFRSKCIGHDWAYAQNQCALGTVPTNFKYLFLGNPPFQPLITYAADGHRDYVRDIIVAPPTLTSFTSSSASGTYGPGSAIAITAVYDEPIKIGSTLTATLDTGREVTLSAVSGSQISGTYTVGAFGSGEYSSDLRVVSIKNETVHSNTVPVRTRKNSLVPETNIATSLDIAVDTRYQASNIIGQYVGADALRPLYTQRGINNNEGSVNPRGFVAPFAIAQDSVSHRLFVADRANNRVLVYNLNNSNALTDRVPDAVLGQLNFTSNAAATSQNGMKLPSALAYDSTDKKLFVGDTGNHRVLIFNAASTFTNGQLAEVVLGQPDFATAGVSYHSWGMKSPSGLVYARNGSVKRLFVADTGNHRVLIFNAAAGFSDKQSSVAVLGQAGYGSNSAGTTISRMRSPSGLAYDIPGKRLFVADTNNNRVLMFDVESIGDGEDASRELGQPIETAFTSRGVITPPTAWSMNEPVGLAYDASTKKLFVSVSAENRILVFHVNPLDNGESAGSVMGQIHFAANSAGTTQSGLRSPRGIAYDGANDKLFVADMLNNRILMFNY